MSAEQLPCIQQLKQEQEKESIESRQKLRKSLGSEHVNGDKDEVEKQSTSGEKKTEVKVVIDEEKLFNKRPSIFESRNENGRKSNIFASNKSVNLFNTNQSNTPSSGVNIFTMAASSQPLFPNEAEDDLVSHSSQGQDEDNTKHQFLPEPTEKEMKFNYETTVEKIGQFKLIRFKNGINSAKEGMLCSIEQDKKSHKALLMLVVRNPITKLSIYEALLLPNTKTETFMGKSENLKLMAVKVKKVEDKVTTERQTVKLQFESPEEAKRFEEVLSSHCKEENKSNKSNGATEASEAPKVEEVVQGKHE